MNEPSPRTTPVNDELLAQDVEGALLLLSYAAQSGIEVDAATAQTVAHSKQLFAAAQLHDDALAAFYLALQKLSAAASPVTVAGLRAAVATGAVGGGFSGLFRGTLPESRKAIRWYWLWTVLWLLILVAVQIYWVIGSTAVTKLKQGNQDLAKAQYELALIKEKLPKGKAVEATIDGRRLVEAIENLRNEKVAYTEILSKWNRVLGFGLSRLRPAGVSSDTAAGGAQAEAEQARIQVMLARIPFALLALQVYVLPLLYGLLGACTYVLRMLSRDVHAFSYTPDSHIRYKIRLVLGTLSGLAVTWFFDAGAESVASLSPLALAFLAGYSVEILFAAMDRFVTAFSMAGHADAARPGQPATRPTPAGRNS